MIKQTVNKTIDVIKSHFEIDKIKLSSEEFHVGIEGGDIALLLHSFSDGFSEFIENRIMTTFNDQMIHSVENLINYAIDIAPTIVGIEDFGLEISYALVDKGIYVSDDYLSVVFDGHVDRLGQS